MRSRISHVEAANAGMRLYWFWHRLLVLLIEKTVLLTSKRGCNVQVLTRNFNPYPMPTCIFLGCVIIMAIISLGRIGTKSGENDLRFREMSSGMQMINCWRDTISILDILFNNTKLVNCNRRYSLPNKMISVTCSRGKVNFSCSPVALQLVLGNDSFL